VVRAHADLAALDRLHRRVLDDRIAGSADHDDADDETTGMGDAGSSALGAEDERVANGVDDGVQSLGHDVDSSVCVDVDDDAHCRPDR
jgi:hypothetical protein